MTMFLTTKIKISRRSLTSTQFAVDDEQYSFIKETQNMLRNSSSKTTEKLKALEKNKTELIDFWRRNYFRPFNF